MKTLRKLLEIVLNELYDQIEESERYYNWYLEEKDKNEALEEENKGLREKLSAIGGVGDDM
nr:MAG TPA: Initiation-control protein YabA, DnaA, DnaN, Zinc finger.7A [Caudoviricetes sp.]